MARSPSLVTGPGRCWSRRAPGLGCLLRTSAGVSSYQVGGLCLLFLLFEDVMFLFCLLTCLLLFSDRHVLTAAHCQPGFLASLLVELGEYDISGPNEFMSTREQKVMIVIMIRAAEVTLSRSLSMKMMFIFPKSFFNAMQNLKTSFSTFAYCC